MNTYYELIYLKDEIKEIITGGNYLFSISPHKNVIEIFIENKGQKFRLIFSTHPTETVLFLDDYRPPKKSNVFDFFGELKQERITGVSLAHLDRLVTIQFESGYELVFKVFSGKPNCYLVKDGIVHDAYKRPDVVKGQEKPKPEQPTFHEEVSPDRSTKNKILELNPLLPRHLIPDLIECNRLEEYSDDQLHTFVDQATDQMLHDPVFRVLEKGEVCLWSEKFISLATHKRFDSINNCVGYAYKNTVHARRLSRKKESVLGQLKQARKKYKHQLKQLKQADKSLDRADTYEKYGHILMAHVHENWDNYQDEVELENFYKEGETVTIPIKPRLSIQKNAERYYQKSKDARQSYYNAVSRIDSVQEEIETLDEMIREIEAFEHLPELRKWIKQHNDEISTYVQGDTNETEVSPFRKYQLGKYEIWVGRNANSNDQLTSHAHKEDIWLHAREVPGSHTVIRMGNDKDYPPKPVIDIAASIAAHFSKLKGSDSVPVIYTKRKYVRKPKGADPGTVIVERENVTMVPPHKPTKNFLQRANAAI